MTSSLSTNHARQVNLSRRLLFPHLSQDESIPQLTDSELLDAELYDTIAMSVRAFVLPWWSKISKNDKDFCSHICRIITHVINELESRLANAKLFSLLLEDTPYILAQHYKDFRLADEKTHTSYAGCSTESFSHTFHAFQNHMAITSDGIVDESYLRFAVDHALESCLPKEDYIAETERFIIREILVDLLQEVLFDRISQPWFFMKIVLEHMGDSPRNIINLNVRILNVMNGMSFFII
jgi:hypothetical protein